MLLVCLFIMLSSCTRRGRAQEVVEVGEEPSCATCVIMLEPVITIGESRGEGALPGFADFARTRDGRFYIVSHQRPSEVFVFDRNGDFVRSFGREGEGPREFKFLRVVHVTRGDTVHLFDSDNVRHVVLSPDWDVVRTARFVGTAREVLELSDGRLVVAGAINTSDGIGYPLHLLSRSGELEHSFGAEAPAYRPELYYWLWRHIAVDEKDRIFAAHHTQYFIDVWDATGTKTREIIRRVGWFEPYVRPGLSPETPPHPSVQAAHVDARGYLWIVLQVPSSDWRSALEEVDTPEGPAYRIVNPDEAFEGMIEVIDPDNGRLLVSQRFPQRLGRILSDSLITSYRVDDLGFRYLDVWRAEFREKEVRQ